MATNNEIRIAQKRQLYALRKILSGKSTIMSEIQRMEAEMEKEDVAYVTEKAEKDE